MDRMTLAHNPAAVADVARLRGMSGHGSPWCMGTYADGSLFGTIQQTTKRPPRRLGMRLT